jgi:hypothetical protein
MVPSRSILPILCPLLPRKVCAFTVVIPRNATIIIINTLRFIIKGFSVLLLQKYVDLMNSPKKIPQK